MQQKVKAFSPANISCVFKIHTDKNPRWAGSLGFGFTINEGVIAEVTKSDTTEILFNKKLINFPAVEKVINSLTKEKVKVDLTTPLPLGCGFGLSGACSLATAYAVDKLLGLKKSKKELATIAHIADVESKTGLGDVTNQYFGGMLVKFESSSHFVVKKLPFENTPVYCISFSKLETKSVLTDINLQKTINSSAQKALEKLKALLLQKDPVTFDKIIALSKEFVTESGLLKDEKTKTKIAEIEAQGGYASMIILGNAVFSNIPFQDATKFVISDKGAHLL